MKAMILAAGLGTRLKPLTDTKPKALIEINKRPMLDYSIAYLVKHGIKEIIINIHHHGEQMIDFINEAKENYHINIEISDERNELLNTGGGLKKASWFLEKESSFVLAAVDIFTNLDLSSMIQHHKKSSALVSLAVKDRETSRSLLFNNNYELVGWRDNRSLEEKKVREDKLKNTYDLGFSGIHVISSKIFELFTETGSFSIIDAYLRLARNNKILGFRHDETQWMEFGRINNFEYVNNNPEVLEFVDW
jgi:NDP-sugar pyrophosphorylase family protein